MAEKRYKDDKPISRDFLTSQNHANGVFEVCKPNNDNDNSPSAASRSQTDGVNSPPVEGWQALPDGVVLPPMEGWQALPDGVVLPPVEGWQAPPDGVVSSFGGLFFVSMTTLKPQLPLVN